jgi:hypothetical protein
MLRVGLDVHGVCDKYTKIFSELSAGLIDSGFEVHIITGQRDTVDLRKKLNSLNIHWSKIHSITDYNQEKGVKVRYDKNGEPWMDQSVWDSTKAKICKENNIDIHYDDSKVYGKWFKKLKTKTLYLLVE